MGGVTVALLLAHALIQWTQKGFSVTDPDTLVRLVRLRAEIESGVTQYLLSDGNLGTGLSLHWSHLLEWVMLPFVMVLKPIFGLSTALLTVGALFGPAAMAALTFSLCWAIAPLARQPRTALAIALLTAFSGTMINYGALGNGDHHVILVVGAVVAWGFALRIALLPAPHDATKPDQTSRGDTLKLALGLGVSTGLTTWISVESLPYCFLGFAAIAWDSATAASLTRRTQQAAALLSSLATLSLVLLLCIAIDPPLGGMWATEVDRISLPWLGVAWTATAAALALRSVIGAGWKVRVGMPALVLGALCLSLVWWLGEALTPLATVMAPELTNFQWNLISENMPISTLRQFLTYAGGAVGGLVLGGLALKADGRSRIALALILAGIPVLAMSMLHVRFSPYLSGLGIAGLAIMHDRLFPARRLTATLVLVLGITVPVVSPTLFREEMTTRAERRHTSNPCNDRAYQVTSGLEGQLVLTHLNESPSLLFWAPGIKVVGANYHRGQEGLAAFMATWASPPAQAREALARLGIKWIVACPSEAPQDREPDPEATLGTFLSSGGLPPWLRLASPFREKDQPLLYQVSP